MGRRDVGSGKPSARGRGKCVHGGTGTRGTQGETAHDQNQEGHVRRARRGPGRLTRHRRRAARDRRAHGAADREASVAPDGTDGNGPSGRPSLSADGSHLAFTSADPGDTNRTTRAYVRDLCTGTTVLAGPDARGGANDQSVSAPVIDRHGRTIAFGSASPDLVPGDTYDTSHVSVRHMR